MNPEIKFECLFFVIVFPFSSYQDLPLVEKLFAPSVRCPKCNHANDIDFRFCQQCGYKRKIIHCRSNTPLDVDVDAIEAASTISLV